MHLRVSLLAMLPKFGRLWGDEIKMFLGASAHLFYYSGNHTALETDQHDSEET